MKERLRHLHTFITIIYSPLFQQSAAEPDETDVRLFGFHLNCSAVKLFITTLQGQHTPAAAAAAAGDVAATHAAFHHHLKHNRQSGVRLLKGVKRVERSRTHFKLWLPGSRLFICLFHGRGEKN